MELGPWLLGAGTVLVTQILTLLADGLRRRWAATSERQRRLDERADEAANRLLDLMDKARESYEDANPNQKDVYALCHQIDRGALLLRDPIARATVHAVSDVLWHADLGVIPAKPKSIAYISANEGRGVLGTLLRGERVKEVPSLLKDWALQVKEIFEEPEE